MTGTPFVFLDANYFDSDVGTRVVLERMTETPPYTLLEIAVFGRIRVVMTELGLCLNSLVGVAMLSFWGSSPSVGGMLIFG